MTTPPSSPELTRAADYLRAGERDAAGRLLKAYLTDHPRDADAWWLMALAVRRPENVRTCLERVLRLRPDDPRAKARIAQLDRPDEPDDSFFAIRASAPAPVNTRQPVPPNNAPVPFDPTLDLGEPFDPFAGIDAPSDPFTALRGQRPGTGNQPEWGPGLGFISQRQPAKPERPARRSGLPRKTVGLIAAVCAGLVLIAALLVVAQERGWIHLGGLPAMRALDGGSFALEYPEDWGAECTTGLQGALVCGIANDPRFNEVDLYTGNQVDFAQQLSSAISGMLSFEELPDLSLSVIAIDAPPGSPYFQQPSQAQMMHEILTEYGSLSDEGVQVEYDERDETIDGRPARVYRLDVKDTTGALETFVTGGEGDWALYDVYIPHDGTQFWMTVQAVAFHNRAELPRDVIEHMIDSIDLKAE